MKYIISYNIFVRYSSCSKVKTPAATGRIVSSYAEGTDYVSIRLVIIINVLQARSNMRRDETDQQPTGKLSTLFKRKVLLLKLIYIIVTVTYEIIPKNVKRISLIFV